MPRDAQYSKEESDLYVSEFAEDGLDEGNPFKQDPADQPIADPDAAAVAAVLSRNDGTFEETNDATDGLTNADITSAVEERQPGDKEEEDIGNGLKFSSEDGNSNARSVQAQADKDKLAEESDESRFAGLFTPKEESASASELNERNPERRQSSPKRRGPLMDAVAADDVNDSDPEVRRLIKRARRDSRTLLVRPGDGVEEEDAKMRANLDLRGIVIKGNDAEDLEHGDKALDFPAGDDVDRPTEVMPMTLMEKLSEHKDYELIPRDPGDDDDDIEAKRGDDYDVENYEEFEDDQDDMGEEMEEDGPEMDERLMYQEDELIPGRREEVPALR